MNITLKYDPNDKEQRRCAIKADLVCKVGVIAISMIVVYLILLFSAVFKAMSTQGFASAPLLILIVGGIALIALIVVLSVTIVRDNSKKTVFAEISDDGVFISNDNGKTKREHNLKYSEMVKAYIPPILKFSLWKNMGNCFYVDIAINEEVFKGSNSYKSFRLPVICSLKEAEELVQIINDRIPPKCLR